MTEEGHAEPLARRAYEELAETYAALAPVSLAVFPLCGALSSARE